MPCQRPAPTLLLAAALAAAAGVPAIAAAPAAAQDPAGQGPAGQAPAVQRQGAPAASHAEVAPAAGRSLGAVEAKALLGRSVVTRDGQGTGAIEDFTLGGPGGTVDHAVIGSGGVLGVGATLVLVPVDRLRVGAPTSVPGPGEKAPLTVILDISAADLAASPAFADDGSVRTLAGAP